MRVLLLILALLQLPEDIYKTANADFDAGRWAAGPGEVVIDAATAEDQDYGVGKRMKLGYTRAVWQLAHTLGLPPFLGRTELRGAWLNSEPSAATWLSAAGVAAVVAALTWRWRRTQPRRARLGAMAAVVALAGLYNGAQVPEGLEQNRLPFYWWTFVLAFLVALMIGQIETISRA